VRFRCFRCFGRKITAAELSFPAEILGFWRLGARENSETPAVFSLFSAVSVDKCNNLKGGLFTKNEQR
jgi:hypothetical protein